MSRPARFRSCTVPRAITCDSGVPSIHSVTRTRPVAVTTCGTKMSGSPVYTWANFSCELASSR